MNEESIQEAIVLNFIRKTCAEKPHLLPKVIDYTTEGVKDFAQKQKDFGSKMGFAMTEIIDNTKQEKFGCFSRKEIIELTRPWLDGTPWFKKHTSDIDKSNAVV